MDEIQKFRKEVVNILLTFKNKKGEQMMTESKANELCNILTDAELADGILFNSPEDVAQIIIETFPNPS